MTVVSGSCWYVVQRHVQAATKAAVDLVSQAYCICLPRYLKRRRHARRIATIIAPLFPRHLLVAIDQTTRWRAIQSTVGMAQLVGNGDELAPVPPSIVEQLRSREDARALIKLELDPRFSPGDKVRGIDGVFFSCLGLFEGMPDRERVAILLDLLGRKVRVVLDAECVVAA